MSVWTRIAEILSDVGDSIAAAWEKITDQIGRDSQIALYKASLGL